MKKGMITIGWVLASMLVLFASTIDAIDDGYTARDQKVGRVIMSTIGKEIVTKQPGPGLMRDITSRCEGEDIYCYETKPLYEVNGRSIQYTWNAKIEFNQPYEKYEEIPIPESWRNSKESKDSETGGVIYFRQAGSGAAPLGRVVIKKLVNGVLLTMTETRPVRSPYMKWIQKVRTFGFKQPKTLPYQVLLRHWEGKNGLQLMQT